MTDNTSRVAAQGLNQTQKPAMEKLKEFSSVWGGHTYSSGEKKPPITQMIQLKLPQKTPTHMNLKVEKKGGLARRFSTAPNKEAIEALGKIIKDANEELKTKPDSEKDRDKEILKNWNNHYRELIALHNSKNPKEQMMPVEINEDKPVEINEDKITKLGVLARKNLARENEEGAKKEYAKALLSEASKAMAKEWTNCKPGDQEAEKTRELNIILIRKNLSRMSEILETLEDYNIGKDSIVLTDLDFTKNDSPEKLKQKYTDLQKKLSQENKNIQEWALQQNGIRKNLEKINTTLDEIQVILKKTEEINPKIVDRTVIQKNREALELIEKQLAEKNEPPEQTSKAAETHLAKVEETRKSLSKQLEELRTEHGKSITRRIDDLSSRAQIVSLEIPTLSSLPQNTKSALKALDEFEKKIEDHEDITQTYEKYKSLPQTNKDLLDAAGNLNITTHQLSLPLSRPQTNADSQELKKKLLEVKQQLSDAQNEIKSIRDKISSSLTDARNALKKDLITTTEKLLSEALYSTSFDTEAKELKEALEWSVGSPQLHSDKNFLDESKLIKKYQTLVDSIKVKLQSFHSVIPTSAPTEAMKELNIAIASPHTKELETLQEQGSEAQQQLASIFLQAIRGKSTSSDLLTFAGEACNAATSLADKDNLQEKLSSLRTRAEGMPQYLETLSTCEQLLKDIGKNPETSASPNKIYEKFLENRTQISTELSQVASNLQLKEAATKKIALLYGKLDKIPDRNSTVDFKAGIKNMLEKCSEQIKNPEYLNDIQAHLDTIEDSISNYKPTVTQRGKKRKVKLVQVESPYDTE